MNQEFEPCTGDRVLRAGDWFTIEPAQIIDLDVIIGEGAGGLFNAFLMIEKRGTTYQTDEKGHLILPIFPTSPLRHPVAKRRS